MTVKFCARTQTDADICISSKGASMNEMLDTRK